MSGPFGSQSWMYKLGDFYSHLIDNSARLDTNSYYTRTPSSAGNQKTWTWSGWVKRVGIGTTDTFFAGIQDDNNRLVIGFNTDSDITVVDVTGGSATTYLQSNAQFRDPSSWYHFVISLDTTESTASDRLKIYVNGSELTSYSTDNRSSITLNGDEHINNTISHTIGTNRVTSITYFNGYLAEINFIDGQALDATYFGQNKSGVWTPKSYTGSYGTNGFYLDFATRATDPIDASGNGNNWGSVNVVSTDWMLDSPTNNWSVLNSVADNGSGVYSEGNLKCLVGATTYPVSSITMLGGKWYCEAVGLNSGFGMMGIIPARVAPTQVYPGAGGSLGYGYYFANGNLYAPSGVTSYGSSYTANDIISIALDLDGGTLTFYKNGVSQGTAATGITGEWVFAFSDADANAGNYNVVVNFGQDSSFAGNKTAQGNTDANGRGDFYYSVPSGYLALCSANLDDPASSINPILNANPQDHFNTVLYTGDGTSSNAITGVGFQPDWLWIKSRSTVASHSLFDAVRGSGSNGFYGLQSDTTIAEFDGTNVSSLDTDGFTLGGSNAPTNASGATYVAWNWKAGGTGVSNTVGTITSTVSANQDLGISIVTFTANGTGSTVGTGLSSSAPLDMVIIKRRDSTSDWQVGHRFTGQSTNFAWHTNLNDTSALSGVSPFYLGTSSATQGHYVQLGSVYPSGETWVAYCFQEVKGVSKFGSYTGTGSTDGPFVYCGFRPAFVLWKRTDSTGSWNILDRERDIANIAGNALFPDLSNAEYAGAVMDIVSNGFKLRDGSSGNNGSGGTYIYMAFAEMPFKYANAR